MMASRISSSPAVAPWVGPHRLLSTAAEWRRLNALYVSLVSQRALGPAEDGAAWRQRTVTVFLRHDNRDVFCVHYGDAMVIANWVRLRRPRLLVDPLGRQQTLEQRGPLPNGRSIHAVLCGELAECSEAPQQPIPATWRGVVYHPVRDSQFVLADIGAAVFTAAEAMMAPGSIKVWIP